MAGGGSRGCMGWAAMVNAMGEWPVHQHSQNDRQVTKVLLLSWPPYL